MHLSQADEWVSSGRGAARGPCRQRCESRGSSLIHQDFLLNVLLEYSDLLVSASVVSS